MKPPKPSLPESPRKVAPKPTYHPAFGMWADRKDLADPLEFVRKLRQPRFVIGHDSAQNPAF